MITSFNRDSCANLPGVVCFHFAPANQVCNWPEREGVYINEEPEFATPFEWLSGFAVMDSADFNEEPEENDAGTRYNTSFVGLFPKNTPGVLQLFTEMEKVTHVIRITDKHGQIRLCGTPENPLRFRFTQALGTSPETLNSYRFEFFGSSYAPSPYIISGAVPPITPPFPPCPPIPPGGSFNTLLNGSGAPDNTLGINGDFYIDTVAWQVYGPKTSGAWGTGTNIEGPQGPQGDPGPQGPQGPAGPTAVSTDAGNGATLGTDGLLFVPMVRKKVMTGNLTNTSGVLVDITELSVPILANQTLVIKWFLRFSETPSNGVRFAITGPTGATGECQVDAPLLNSDTTRSLPHVINGAESAGSYMPFANPSSLAKAVAVATIKNGSNAGNVTLRFRSVSTGQTSTINASNSHVVYL